MQKDSENSEETTTLNEGQIREAQNDNSNRMAEEEKVPAATDASGHQDRERNQMLQNQQR